VAWRTDAVGLFHDDGIYLITARALAEGRGYVIDSLPAAIPQTKYPVLFPALLAALWKLDGAFPGNLALLKALPLLCGIMWLGLTWWLLRRWEVRGEIALGSVVLTGACGFVVFLSTSLLSETLFALCAAIAVGCFAEYERSSGGKWLAGAAAAALAAYHTRSIGVALLAAGLLMLLIRRRWKHAAVYAVGVLAGILPWMIWQRSQKVADAYLSSANYYADYNILFNFAGLEKLRIAAWNLLLLPASAGTLTGIAELAWLGFPLLFLVLRGWRRAMRGKNGFLAIELFLGLTLAIVVVWAWVPGRFLAPLLPWIAWLAWEGWPERWKRWAGVLAFVVAGWMIAGNWRSTVRAAETAAWIPWDWNARAGSEYWTAMRAQAAWLRANVQPGEVVAGNLDPTLHLLSGMKCVRASGKNAQLGFYLGIVEPLGGVEEFRKLQVRRGVRYLVLANWPWFPETLHLEKLVGAWRAKYPGELNLAEPEGAEGFGIFRVEVPAGAAYSQ
jgi:hypothetical protein